MTKFISSRNEIKIGFRIPMPNTESEEERLMYLFRKKHYEEILDEEKQFTACLPPAEDVLNTTTFEQKSFNDKNSATYFSESDVKHYKDSVASISLFHGDTMLFACSGTALPQGRESLNVARFVTSARLSTEFNNKRSKDDILSIRVRLPDNTITDGFLGLYDDSIAIVHALLSYVHPVDLYLSKEERKCEPTNLIIAGLAADPMTSLMVEGVNTLSSGQKRPRHPRAHSPSSVSCDITEAGLGGPVIAFCHGTELEFLAGVIVSYDCKSKLAVYIQTDALCQRLRQFQILTNKAINFRGYSLPSGVRCAIPSGLDFGFLFRGSYPWVIPPPPPLVCELNGKLLNMFEEDFGRLLAWEGYPFCVSQRGYGEDVWEELPKHVVLKVELSVVSLASFKEDVRFFACTGVLINWPEWPGEAIILTSASLVRTEGGKIEENLRIKVFVPPQLFSDGKLALYHQNYNIAIIRATKSIVRDDGDISRWDLTRKPLSSSEVVVAIGRNPSKGLLMASKGKVAPPYKHCELKCKALKLSTCQIKKAGIGGPLIDVNGNFVGMNFYDGNTTTPFLPRSTILKAFKTVDDPPSSSGWTVARGVMNTVVKNWWPVPEAYWYHGELDLDKSVLPRHVGKVRH